MSSKQDHTYRKKDVTGALPFVCSLFADQWDNLDKDSRPRTDREATILFFQVDREGYNLDEFLEQLQAWRVVEQLTHLSKEKRKPGKRIGTLNVLTGKVQNCFPDFLILPADAYDELLNLIRWVESIPECVDLSEGTWDAIHDAMMGFINLDSTRWSGVFVDSVQIETPDTSERNITPGTLVALLMCEDDSADQEFHCVLVRGEE